MKKSLKFKVIAMMGLALCLSLALGFATFATPAPKADATAPATFEMLGMSIRYSEAAGDDGIRFGVKLDKTTYTALSADGNALAGILVTPTDQIDGASLTLATAAASNARDGVLYNGSTSLNNWTVDEDYATGIVYLHGFPTESYNRPITAVAYIDWDGDGADANYSDTVEISMADVALAVTTDYAGSNTYGTTAAQAEKLDAYLLNYDVNFLDAYNNVVDTQSVKFGAELEVADDPATRTGYTFNGWHEKNGESTFAESATDFNATNAKKVKYARTFKPGFNTNGTTFEKPAIGVGHARAVAKGLQGDTSVTDGVLSVRGAYYFDGAEVENGSDYLVQMTFTAAGGDLWFALSDDQAAGYGRIEYHTGNNKFYIYNYTSGTYRGTGWNWYDSIEERGNAAAAIVAESEYTLTMVHKNGKYTIFIDGVKATSFSESEELTMYGEKSDPVKHVTDIVGDGEKVYLGIGSINATTAVSDWRYSVDAETIETFVPTERSDSTMLAVTNFKSNVTNGGGYNYSAAPAESGSNPSFDVTATEAAGSTSTYVGFTFSAYGDNKLYVGYNKTTSRVRVQVGEDYREYTIRTDGGYSNGYNAESANTFRLVYNGGAAMTFYINGQEAYLTNGFNNCICLRYGMDGDGGAAFCSGNGSVKAWHGFAGSGETQGNERTLYIGTFGNGMTVASFPIANFKSNVTNGGGYNYSAAPAESGSNPSFDVTMIEKAGSTSTYVGFTFSAYGDNKLYVGYNKTTSRVRVQVGEDYREYTIRTDGGYSNGYNAEGDNTFRLVYNGGAAMTFYINGQEAYLTNGFNNCICLRYGMDGDGGAAFCSGKGSVKAWHGFAGSGETQGNERTLYIGTFATV